jgi:hypothetical protein
MAKKNSSILGRYRITEMPDFGEEYLDEEAPAFIRFEVGGGGEFHFGYVQGIMDLRTTQRDGKPAIEWSWEGNDGDHVLMGHGRAVLEEDGMLSGIVFVHEGDEYSFRAKKWAGGNAKKKPKGRSNR